MALEVEWPWDFLKVIIIENPMNIEEVGNIKTTTLKHSFFFDHLIYGVSHLFCPHVPPYLEAFITLT